MAENPDYIAEDLARYTAIDAESVFRTAQTYLSAHRVRIDVVPVVAGDSNESDTSQGGE